MAFLAVIMGALAYVIVVRLNNEAAFIKRVREIKEACLEARRQEKNYIIRKNEESASSWENVLKTLGEGINQEISASRDESIRNMLTKAKSSYHEYKGFFLDLKVLTESVASLG